MKKQIVSLCTILCLCNTSVTASASPVVLDPCYEGFPTKYEGLKNALEDPHRSIEHYTWYFLLADGINTESSGTLEALEWTRKAVAIRSDNPPTTGLAYLMLKGDAQDVELLNQHTRPRYDGRDPHAGEHYTRA